MQNGCGPVHSHDPHRVCTRCCRAMRDVTWYHAPQPRWESTMTSRRGRALLTMALLTCGGAGALHAQDGATITGVVRNEAGQPLAAATVFLTQLNIGTQTREDGRYTLVVPAARTLGQTATLTARIIGYRAQSSEI